MNILYIAQHELRRIFVSPLAWAILAVLQLMLGVVFLLSVVELASNPQILMQETVGVSQVIVGSVFSFASLMFLLVVPLLTMRMLSEERRSGSLDLYRAAPVSLTDLVLGKFLGLCGFLLVLMLLSSLMPLALMPATPLDLGRIGAGMLGLFLMMIAFGAAGLFISSLTEQPVIAAIGSLVLLLVMWLIGWFEDWTLPFFGKEIPVGLPFAYLSMTNHFDSFIEGVFNTADVLYYFLFSAVFLTLTVQRLDMERH
ncbi:MAG: ABC transporter permease [Nevskiales bacterium]